MSKISKILMAGALAIATVVPTLSEAGPMANVPLKVEKASDATNVRCERCRYRSFRGQNSMRAMTRAEARGDMGSRYYRSNRNWRHYSYRDRGYRYRDYGRYSYRDYGRYRYYRSHRYYRDSAFWAPGLILAPSIVLGPRTIVRRSSYAGSHVRWCERRYVSYSARTDTFMSNDGYRKRCISPYR